ncbi:MAG: DUF6079 family protein [bacterium]
MRIGDFITFQDFPAVIRPDHAAQVKSGGDGSSWVKQYALTAPDHRKMLEEILSSMAWGQHGKAILINGLYGTGKSHLLALLDILASNESAWMGFTEINPLFERFTKKMIDKRILPVFFSLDDYPPAMTLEEAVLFEISRSLGVTVSGKSRLNDWLEISHAVKEKGHGGLLLLVDELSIFLASRSPSRREADAGFIQFIAGMTERTNLWFIGALQRNLSDTGMMKFHSWRQVEDRFKKYTLQPSQITDVIRNRMFILRNQPELRQMLESISTDGIVDRVNAWPFIPNALETFMQMVNNHLSPHRTLVQVMQSLAPGWMDRECEDVITIDQLFDAVQNDLTGCASAVKTYSATELLLNLSSRAPEPAIAGKAIKTLAAFSLAEMPGITIELGKASLINDTKLLSYNLHWLRKRGAHLTAIRDTDPGKEIFSLNIDDDAGILAAARADEVMNSFLKGDRRIYETVISSCKYENWPLGNFGVDATAVQFNWMNTVRNCAIVMANKPNQSLSDIFNGILHDDNYDCAMAMVFPGLRGDFTKELTALPMELQNCAAIITPRDIAWDEYELLAEYAAWEIAANEKIAASSALENKTNKRCQERANEMRVPAITILTNLYRDGKWLIGNDSIDMAGKYDAITEMLSAQFSKGLMERFAGAVKYAPAGDPPRAIARQLHQFVIDTGGVSATSSTLMHYTRQYLLPSESVIENEDGLTLNVPADEIIQMMSKASTNAVTLKEMIAMMHKSPFGLPGELSSLIIHTAVRTGALAGYDSFMHQIDPLTALSRSDTLTFISNQPTIRVDHRIKLKELCETAGLSELSIFALRRFLEKSKVDCGGFDLFITEWCSTNDSLPWIWRESSELISNLEMMDTNIDTEALLDVLEAAGDKEFIIGVKNIKHAIEKQGILSRIGQILHLTYSGNADNKINELRMIMANGDKSLGRIDELVTLTNEIEAIIQREYSVWHESIFGQAQVAQLKTIFESADFRLARRLALIHTDWPADVYAPPAILAQAREKYCPGGLLHDFTCPRCRSQFNTPSPMPTTVEAKQAAEDALSLAAIHLQNSEWTEKLRERTKRANDEMREKAQMLLNWSRGKAELTAEILDDNFITWLNQSSQPVAVRKTNEIKYQLSGRDLSHKEAKNTLNRWLDPMGNLNDEAVLTFE